MPRSPAAEQSGRMGKGREQAEGRAGGVSGRGSGRLPGGGGLELLSEDGVDTGPEVLQEPCGHSRNMARWEPKAQDRGDVRGDRDGTDWLTFSQCLLEARPRSILCIKLP